MSCSFPHTSTDYSKLYVSILQILMTAPVPCGLGGPGQITELEGDLFDAPDNAALIRKFFGHISAISNLHRTSSRCS